MKVLVVDDSAFMRGFVRDAAEAGGHEVIEAKNGAAAVSIVVHERPDVVTMDVEMPRMNGIDAVSHIMSSQPTPVLMLSSHTERGAEATFDALSAGAVEFLSKPNGDEAPGSSDFGTELRAKLETAADANVSAITTSNGVGESVGDGESGFEFGRTLADGAASGEASDGLGANRGDREESEARAADGPVEADAGDVAAAMSAVTGATADEVTASIDPVDRNYVVDPTVVIGASTGGPKVLERVLYDLPRTLDARVLVVQHMPAKFTGRLAARLDAISAYDVREAEDGARIGGGEALVARGGEHLVVSSYGGGRLRVESTDDPPVDGARPAIDLTMTSVAEVIPDPVVGVVLTGVGRDGVRGVGAIKRADGSTVAQDNATSAIWEMPGSAVESGSVDTVTSATNVARAIERALEVDP